VCGHSIGQVVRSLLSTIQQWVLSTLNYVRSTMNQVTMVQVILWVS